MSEFKNPIYKVGMKTLWCSIMAMFLCFLLNLSFAVLSTHVTFLGVINQIFTIFLVCSLLYSPAWDCGDKDSNLYAFGHIKKDLFRGIKIGLFAYVPMSIPGIVLLCVKLANVSNEVFAPFIKLFRMFNAPFFITMLQLFPETTIESVSYWDILIVFLLPIIFWASIVIAYILGFKKISLREKLIYKNKK